MIGSFRSVDPPVEGWMQMVLFVQKINCASQCGEEGAQAEPHVVHVQLAGNHAVEEVGGLLKLRELSARMLGFRGRFL